MWGNRHTLFEVKFLLISEHIDWRNTRRNVSWIYTRFSIVGSNPTTVKIDCIRDISHFILVGAENPPALAGGMNATHCEI